MARFSAPHPASIIVTPLLSLEDSLLSGHFLFDPRTFRPGTGDGVVVVSVAQLWRRELRRYYLLILVWRAEVDVWKTHCSFVALFVSLLLERDHRFGRAVLVRCSFSFDSSIAVISIEACDVAA